MIRTGEIVWMVDGTYLPVTKIMNKYVEVEGDRKVLKTNLNRQYKTNLLLELQEGVKEFP